MLVALSPAEVQQAAFVGRQRRIRALELGRQQRHGHNGDDCWSMDIEGAGAEMAYAKFRNRYWLPVAEDPHDLPGDVGNVQIRSTPRRTGSLILHKDDPDDAYFVLMVGRLPTFVAAGWLVASAGKDARWWREDVREAAYFVPQTELSAFPA